MSVRDSGFDPRPSASRSMAHPMTPPPNPGPRRWIGPAIIAGAVFTVLAAVLWVDWRRPDVQVSFGPGGATLARRF